MPRFQAIPANGRDDIRSPDHGGACLPTDGWPVEWSTYWQRRFDDGDITRAEVQDEEEPDASPSAVEAQDPQIAGDGRRSRGAARAPAQTSEGE